MSLRKQCREQISTCLAEVIEDDDINIDDIASRIEKECNNMAIRVAKNYNIPLSWKSAGFVATYETQYLSVINNLTDDVIAKLSDGETGFGFMTPSELDPDANKEIRQRITDRENTSVDRKYSTDYKCGRCKQKKCTIRSYQARSSDEPRTVIAECLICTNTWRLQ